MVGRQGRRLKNAMDCGVRSTCPVAQRYSFMLLKQKGRNLCALYIN
jgi:hypothetical protein